MYDWLLGGEINSKVFNLSYFTEREEGGYYWGSTAGLKFKIKTIELDAIQSIKTAKKIDFQKVAMLYNYGSLGIGVAQTWIGYKSPALLLQTKFTWSQKNLSLALEYADNFKTRKIIGISERYFFKPKKEIGWGIVQKYKYERITGKKPFWHFQVGLGRKVEIEKAARRIPSLSPGFWKWSMLATLWAGGFCDALQDAYTWGGGKTYFLIDKGNWHAFKAGSNVAYGLSGITLSWTLAKKKIRPLSLAKNFIGGLILNNLLWDWTYRYARYKNPADYSPEHNRHAIVYWKGGKDKYIGLNEVTGPIWDVARAIVGTYLVK